MEKIEDVIYLIDSQEKEKTQNLLFKYLKKWPWFLGFILIGTFAGYFVYKNTPPIYQVGSRILVKGDEKDLNSVLAFNNSGSDQRNTTNLDNQIGMLRSFTLFRSALENLNWKYSWYQKEMLYNYDLYQYEPFTISFEPNSINIKNVPVEIELINEKEISISAKGKTYQNGFPQAIDFNADVKLGEPFSNEYFNFTLNKGLGSPGKTYILLFNDVENMTSSYLAKTDIYAEDDKSDIIAISIQGQTPQREADFINQLNKVFIESGMENKFQSSKKSVEFIDSQLQRLKDSLSLSAENISNYRKNNQAVDLGREAQTVSTQLEEIERDQYMSQMQIDFYNNLLEYIDDAQRIEEIINPAVVGITDENLTGLLTKLRELYSRREVLSLSVQNKMPAYVAIEREIKVARDGLEQTLKNQLQGTQLKLNALNERYNSIQQRYRKLPETEKKLIGVQREFDLNNEFYTYMLQKKAEVSISKASIAPEVQVVDEAIIEAARQTGPNLIMNVAIGLFGGGILPFIFITLSIFFNNKIETISEVEKGSKIPVFEGIMKHKYKLNMPVIHHPRSGIAENFRGLKTNINTLVQKTGNVVISINSLIPGEGKSFISSNLAATFSKTNKKILLIGADLHKPTLQNFLNVKESFGLSNYLNNEKTIDDIIAETSIPNLHFIQTGTILESPSDLLDSAKFEKLIDYTRKLYDYIIIDNAPLLLIPDTILTSQYSDISLFIVRANHSHKNQIKQINKIVEFNKIDCAAILLNDVRDNGYGYGYGYRKKYWKNGYGEYRSNLKIV